MIVENLSRHEINALYAKYCSNRLVGKFSHYLIIGLINKGLLTDDKYRLTEDGLATIEYHVRQGHHHAY